MYRNINWKKGPRCTESFHTVDYYHDPQYYYDDTDFWYSKGVFEESRIMKSYASIAFSCILLPQHTYRDSILQRLVNTGLEKNESKTLFGKARGGCNKTKRLIYEMIGININDRQSFSIDWDSFSLPLEIIQTILINLNEPMMMRTVLKIYSAGSIIWHYWKVFNMVRKNGDENGMECDECGITTYRIKRIKKEMPSLMIYETSVTKNDYDDTEHPGHTWFCYDCYDKHIYSDYNGNYCTCGLLCYY